MPARTLRCMAICGALLTFSSCETGTNGGDAPPVLPVPPDLMEADWLEERSRRQMAAAEEYGVYHEFSFANRLEESGITFHHRVVDDAGKHYKPVHYDHGNGVAVADVDGDGRLDIYFTTQVGRNELWRNRGDGSFDDVTDAAGVGVADRIGVSASFADVDNDGDPDLFVTTVRDGNLLLENDGSGRFADVTERAGLGYAGHSSAAVFFDYDRDGWLDLFLVNVGDYTTDERAPAGADSFYVGRADAFSGHLFPERAERSILYRNLGDGRFRDVSEETGLVDERWSGDAIPFDANADGWPDLYVLSMQGDDGYWENVEGRRFVERGRELFPRTPWGAMGVQALDYDNDGLRDLLLTDMHSDMWDTERFLDYEEERRKPRPEVIHADSLLGTSGTSIFGNALFHNLGDGRFEEVADEMGAETYWPWGVSAGDLNADGWEDAFIASSMNFPFRYQTDKLLLNEAGRRFVEAEFVVGVEPKGEVAAPWFTLECGGADRNEPFCREQELEGSYEIWGAVGSRSSALFDLEGDGDLDIVTNQFQTPPRLLVSDLSERKPGLRWLGVRLSGTASNRDGLGAVVRVRAGDREYLRVHDGQSGYLSQSSLPLYFGLGDAEAVDRIEVDWPSGRRQALEGPLETNRTLEIVEPSGP